MEAQQRGIRKELNGNFGSEGCSDWTEEFNSLSSRENWWTKRQISWNDIIHRAKKKEK